MNLTVEQLIARAIKALDTGQPSLAVLYMRKALVILAVDKTVSVFDRLFSPLAAGLASVSEGLSRFFELVLDAFGVPPVRSDFALVGPI